ncbi:MAG: ribonuclease III [Anaerolineae bacterium]
MNDYRQFEQRLGITFDDKSLLQRALTHPSYLNENPDYPLPDNERLEFLGDAVLDFLTGEYLYHHFPEMDEGELTSLRAALVRTETLAKFAAQLQLGQHLYMGQGEAAGGGRERSGILCAAFEAVIGALYLDQGLELTKEFWANLIRPEITLIIQCQLDKDPKSLLQELAQGRYQLTPTYRTVSARGPDHAREFTVEVLIGKKVHGRGTGRSKQAAEQEAAKQALEALRYFATKLSTRDS